MKTPEETVMKTPKVSEMNKWNQQWKHVKNSSKNQWWNKNTWRNSVEKP